MAEDPLQESSAISTIFYRRLIKTFKKDIHLSEFKKNL